MSFIEEFIITFFQEILLDLIKKLGAAVRWIFLRRRYNFEEIKNQNWNTRIGILTIIFFCSILFLAIRKLKGSS